MVHLRYFSIKGFNNLVEAALVRGLFMVWEVNLKTYLFRFIWFWSWNFQLQSSKTELL